MKQELISVLDKKIYGLRNEYPRYIILVNHLLK